MPQPKTTDPIEPTEDNLYPRLIAAGAYDHLCAALDDLAHRIQVSDADLPAYCARLPLRVRDSEPPTRYEPTSLYGTEARAAAALAVRRLTAPPEQHPGTVFRLPGVIAASPATLEKIENINELKDTLHEKVKLISPARQVRNREIQKFDNAGRVNLVQCTRKLLCLKHAPANVAFTWSSVAHSTLPTRVCDKIEDLLEKRDNPPIPHVDPEAWTAAANAAIDRLYALPGNELIGVREPVAPHPRINYETADGTKKMATLALPLFYPQADPGPLPSLKPLRQLDLTEPRFKRGTPMYEAEPFSKLFGLYRRTPAKMKYADTPVERRKKG